MRKIFLMICLSGALASAQEFYGGGVSARTAAGVGIYLPASNNAVDALALNPAGLTALSGPTVNLSLTGILARGEFSNASNSNSSMRRTAGVVPFGAFGTPLGHSRWTIGFGFTPDLLSASKWSYPDTPGALGADYGQQNETAQILAFRSSAGVGYSISPKLAVGMSVGAVFNSNTLDAPYIFQSQPVLKGLKTLLDLHSTGIGWNTNYGMRVKVTRRIEIGAAYRTKTNITSHGRATGNLDAQFATLGVTADPTFGYRAQVNAVLPQSALASANWQFNPRLRLSAQGDWTDWYRSFRDLPVTLTGGPNAVVNSILQNNTLFDTVPCIGNSRSRFVRVSSACSEKTFQ